MNKKITFWSQPGGKTYKRVDDSGSRHVTPQEMLDEANDFAEQGFEIVSSQVHKVVLEKK